MDSLRATQKLSTPKDDGSLKIRPWRGLMCTPSDEDDR